MKRIISVILLIMLLAGQCTVFAETAIDTGIWEKRAYVDEFDLPTDEYYISNKEPIVGKFSNSATTDSLVNAWLYVDNNIVSIKLIEYGDHVVKNAYSQTEYYDVVVMDPAGEKYYFDGYMESGKEVITFDQQNSDIIIKALCGNGTVRFAITEADNATTKYILTIDDTTGIIDFLPCTFIDDINSFCDGLICVGKNNKMGFADTTGNVVIPCEYDAGYTYSFNEELANVCKNDKWGFIDKSGTLVIPCKYDNALAFSEGLAGVKLNNKWGFIDKNGNLIISCEYDSITSFSEGLARVMQNNKWGFIDTTGNLVIPCEYNGVSTFSEGLAGVKSNNKWGFIDKNGNLIISCEYDSITSFSEGLASIKLNDKWGFVDKTGSITIPCEYDSAYRFGNGLACVSLNDKFGFIDMTGDLVLPCEYNYAKTFDEALAYVETSEASGYIDITGNFVVSYKRGSGYTQCYNEGYFAMLKEGKIIIISRDEVQPNWEDELVIYEQKLAEEAEVRRIEAEKQKMLKEYTDKEIIKATQTALNAAGYDCGTPDGIAGKGTAGAITNYQTDKGLNITGTITHELLIALGVIAE